MSNVHQLNEHNMSNVHQQIPYLGHCKDFWSFCHIKAPLDQIQFFKIFYLLFCPSNLNAQFSTNAVCTAVYHRSTATLYF